MVIIMKIDITENKDNALMKRNEVRAIIHHEGKATPPRIEILEEVSKTLKTNKENVVVNKIFGIKGLDQSEAKITVYKDKNDIPKALAEKMKRRTKPSKEQEKKEETAPAAEEKPAEEKKEETPTAPEKPEEVKDQKPETPNGELKAEENEEGKKEEPEEQKSEEKPKEPAAEEAKAEEKKEETKEQV